MGRIKLICFDVDGTLVEGNSWLFLTKGLGCSLKKHLDIFHRAQDGEISFAEGERMLTKVYQEGGKATKAFIKKLYNTIEPRDEAKELIPYLKKKGYIVYLISGAIDIYVEVVAKKLAIEGFYANSALEFDEKDDLKMMHWRIDKGEQEDTKVRQLKELIKNFGINMNEVVFIGDDKKDIEVFKETGRGIAVHCSDEDLIKVAWKTVDSLREIEEVL